MENQYLKGDKEYVHIQLNGLTATVIDGKAHVHLDVDAELEKDELVKILKTVGLD